MTTKDRVEEYLDRYINKLNEAAKAAGGMYDYYVTEGKKRYKIVEHFNFDFREGEGQTSIFCFVEKETGDILKAETWFRPAKGKRGNIFEEKLPMSLGELYIR